MIKQIYLDHAATTPVRDEALEAMIPYFKDNFANPSSIYSAAQRAKKDLEGFRKQIADSIKALPEEIFFTSGGTEADNWAITSAAKLRNKRGKHLVTTAIEHHAVLHTFEALKREGYEVTFLPVEESGVLDPAVLEASLREDTILVSVMMANNEIGTIQPIEEIAEICKARNILFHTDAVQALGAIKIDAQELGADMISFSGHKVYGPKGVGMLYIRKGLRLPPMMHGGSQERRRRAGTENLPAIAGFAKAVELAQAEVDELASRLTEIRNRLIKKVLTTIPHSRLNGCVDRRLPGNANFSFEFIEGESLLLFLNSYGYACSSGSACTSGSLDPSHVLLAIGLIHEVAHGSLRVTIGKDTDPDFVDEFVEVLHKIVNRLREISPLYEDFLAGRITEPSCMKTGDSYYCKCEYRREHFLKSQKLKK